MSVLQYGGGGLDGASPVFLNVTNVNGFSRTPIYSENRMDVMYYLVRLDVNVLFSPGTQKERLQGEPTTWLTVKPHEFQPIPVFRPAPVGPLTSEKVAPHSGAPDYGTPGSYTAKNIVSYLLQPRLRLVWSVEGETMLVSPSPGIKTDARGGPHPVDCQIIKWHSGKTLEMRWIIEAAVSEAPRYTQKPEHILSHTWGMSHEIDNRFFLRRIIEGRVVFDAQAVYTRGLQVPNGIVPDHYRVNFMAHRVPTNMRRAKVLVKLHDDGLTVSYRIEDEETALNVAHANVIAKVEANHIIESEGGPLNPKAVPIGGNNLSAAMGVRDFGVRFLGTLGNWGERMGMGAGLADWGVRQIETTSRAVAISKHTIDISVFGTREATRDQLTAFADALIRKRIGPLKIKRGVWAGFRLVHPIHDAHIHGIATYIGPPLGPKDAALPTGFFDGTSAFLAGNDTEAFFTKDAGANLSPVGDGWSRGTSPDVLVAAALSLPHNKSMNVPPNTPATLPNPIPAFVTTPPDWPRPI